MIRIDANGHLLRIGFYWSMLLVMTEWVVRRRQGRRGRLHTDDDGEHSRQGEQVAMATVAMEATSVPVGDAA